MVGALQSRNLAFKTVTLKEPKRQTKDFGTQFELKIMEFGNLFDLKKESNLMKSTFK